MGIRGCKRGCALQEGRIFKTAMRRNREKPGYAMRSGSTFALYETRRSARIVLSAPIANHQHGCITNALDIHLQKVVKASRSYSSATTAR